MNSPFWSCVGQSNYAAGGVHLNRTYHLFRRSVLGKGCPLRVKLRRTHVEHIEIPLCPR